MRISDDQSSDQAQTIAQRLRIVMVVLAGVFVCLLLRLAYWQVVMSPQLKVEAAQQYQRVFTDQGERGQIITADGFTLVTNQATYNLFAQPQQLAQKPDQIATQLLPILSPYVFDDLSRTTATPSGTLVKEKLTNLQADLLTKLSKSDSKWVSLFKNLQEKDVSSIKQLKLTGLGFDQQTSRAYPEASLAAQITGFVGSNQDGQPTGYFGVEGALNKELSGKVIRQTMEADALGGAMGSQTESSTTQGRDVVLTIRRDIQYWAETELSEGLKKYGAKSGEVVIMEPSTGKILAMAASPTYDQRYYAAYAPELYKNPSVADGYEPGSTFKTLTVAAGIDAGVITPDTQCPRCTGPAHIAGYTLKTWNDVYNPNITMTDALAKSDNTAMIFVAQELGADRFQSYLKKFGIGSPSEVELQEDTSPPYPTKWGPVELATRAFGQGISATTLQMLKAINAIANQGKVMRPTIVERVLDHQTNQEIVTQPQLENQVISPQTASEVTKMMIDVAQHGESQWTASKTHVVAAKTGTSQIAVNGHYDPNKTIASFVGFAPPDNPKFIMMVKLTEPTSSIWAAETAAPLWYHIADKLFLLLNIPPDMSANKVETLTAEPNIPRGQHAATPSATEAPVPPAKNLGD